MLLLTSTSDLVRVVTASAGAIAVHASWVDNALGTITPGRTNTASIATATTTTVVGSPGASTQRNVRMLSIRNTHASVSNAITVNHTDGTNSENLWIGTLLAGEAVSLDAEGRWTLYDVNGVAKSPTGKLDIWLRVVNDVVNATTSFADITGLTTPLLSGRKYVFESRLFHQTNATTTGARFGVNIGATPTTLNLSAIQQITSSVTAAAYGSSAMVVAVDTAAVLETTGPGAVNMLALLYGYIVPSADGTFAVRCASEVAIASGLTVKAGSWLHIREVDN